MQAHKGIQSTNMQKGKQILQAYQGIQSTSRQKCKQISQPCKPIKASKVQIGKKVLKEILEPCRTFYFSIVVWCNKWNAISFLSKYG